MFRRRVGKFSRPCLSRASVPTSDHLHIMPAPPAALTSGEKAALKKIKAKENKAKANPKRAEENKASADAKRERRAATGSKKEFK
ncbi:hypothetical protein WJX82_000812 [Trebouxia sp. C0006]